MKKVIEFIIDIAIICVSVLFVFPKIGSEVGFNLLKVQASKLVKAANSYVLQNNDNREKRFDIIDGDIITTELDSLNYKGKVNNGVVVIDSNSHIIVCVTDGVNSAYKDGEEKKIKIVKNQVCSIPRTNLVLNDIDDSNEINENTKSSKPDENNRPNENNTPNETNKESSKTVVVLEESSKKSDLVFDTVNSMTNANVSVGKILKTNGFYSKNDGGGAYYEVVKDSNLTVDSITVIALKKKLKAKLIIQSRMDVKQFGAKGDGVTDDHLAFEKILSQEIDTITISKGTYNLNNSILTTNKFVQLIGDGQNKTTIKNGTFKTVYGISAANITFDGGATQHIDYVGSDDFDETGTIAFIVSPNKECDVIYKNCTFKNVTVASFAADEPGRGRNLPLGSLIRNNVVDNCTFTDIGKMAIYHSVTSGTDIFTNNSFINMGNLNLLKGEVGALFIGDITNNTRYEAANIIIQNNTFRNLMTHDDFDENVHYINANFIAIKADKAVVDNNTFTDLIGYGHDREGVYTKVRDLTISNNRLINAGLGEGYVCAKAHEGVAFFNIINNTFEGEAGTAIRNYGPGLIEGNTINIRNIYSGITSTLSPTITSAGNTITINSNTFTSGKTGSLTINGTTISSYGKDRLIAISDTPIPIIVQNNIFNPTTNFGSYMSIGNPGESIKILNNTFNLSDKTGNAIYIGVSNDTSNSLNNDTIISGNHFYAGTGLKPTAIDFRKSVGITSHRRISFLNNEIVYSGTGSINVVNAYADSSNEDTLIVNGNTSTSSKSSTIINSQLKNYEIADDNFATFKYNYN